jgi:Protein of unknown function (DUF1501)
MIHSSRGHYCGSAEHHVNRRAFLGTTAGALIGGSVGLNVLRSPAIAAEMKQEQKRAILVFLGGGASQFETWDPKPGQPTGGPFVSIPTAVPGYRMSELMPEMARCISRHTAVIRSVDTGNVDHAMGARVVLRGSRPETGAVKYPTLGAILARELAQRDSTVPDHVALWTSTVGFPGQVNASPDSAGYLGSRYEAINILRALAPEGNKPPESLGDADHKERGELRDLLSRQFSRGRERDATLASHNDAYSRVRGLMASDRLFDISREPQKVRDRYGPTLFGQQALVARRLVEAGVPFVRLNRGWWDSHGENFDIHQELVPELDHVLSVLLDDLAQRGLLEHTLVVTFSEMGRTPEINNLRGRDHFPRMSATLSGCGVKPGVVYGKTNEQGKDIADGRVTVPQFFATVFQTLGIDHQKEYPAHDGRPIPLTDYATKAVSEVLA